MGVDSNIYIGPYVKCKNRLVSGQVENEGCPKCLKPSGAFCSDCGTAKGKYHRMEKQWKINLDDLEEKTNETLCALNSSCYSQFGKAIDVFIPNMKIKGINRHTSLDGRLGEDEIVPIGTDTVAHEIELFKRTCADALEMLEEAYGSYKIEWGVILYFS